VSLYFLNLKSRGRLIAEPDGSDLPNLAAALREALEAAREILASAIRQGAEPPVDLIFITDELGTELAAIPLIEALPASMQERLR